MKRFLWGGGTKPNKKQDFKREYFFLKKKIEKETFAYQWALGGGILQKQKNNQF